MAEIKKQFTSGKMNKDVDERLVPNGEYRDAMNIQVSTSEGSDVGTIQNILGNRGIDEVDSHLSQAFIPNSAVCVGSIADEKNDTFYWFTTTAELDSMNALMSFTSASPQPTLGISHIIQYKKNSTPSSLKPVFTDISHVIYSMYNVLGNPTYDIATQTITIITPTVPVVVGMSLTINDSIGGNVSAGNIVTSIDASILGSVITLQDPLDFLDNLMQPFSQAALHNTTLFFSQNGLAAGDAGDVLGFVKGNLITSINIIDDLLFWTDGTTEPKKINISRSIEGTNINGTESTLLVNPDQGISTLDNILAREKHITVIKRAPKNTLIVETETIPDFGYGVVAGPMNFTANPNNPSQGNLLPGDMVDNQGAGGLVLYLDPTLIAPAVGDILLLNPAISLYLPPDEFQVKLELTNLINNGSSPFTSTPFQIWGARVVSIAEATLTFEQDWNWAIEYPEIKSFKNKFPRFSYRWKYQDGEYSTFAPFTNVIFQPGAQFRYDVKEAYNLAMENTISKSRLSSYAVNLPEDVVSIDILYKESNSPVVYMVDTIYDLNPLSMVNNFEVTPNQLKAALPENQLLRAWDNVPRTALAQEVSGSRVIYGNYLQNYNAEDQVVVSAKTVDRSICDVNYDKKSLKSIRNYALGVSFLDKYGRQSPIFTDRQGDIDIPISKAQDRTQLTAKVTVGTPDWATHQKFYIKDTSNEYYNLAMDRIYNAMDGNIWLSFPSSDRNKVDDETFLILKKGVEGATPVEESNKYKILAIENEAPPFIKRKTSILALARETTVDPFVNGTEDYFIDPDGYPLVGRKKIVISKTSWDSLAVPLTDSIAAPLFEEVELKFTIAIGLSGVAQYSKPYKVSGFSEDTSGNYSFMLETLISDVDEWLSDSTNTIPLDTIGIEISRVSVKDSPEYQGRFFVKISKDPIVNQNVISQATSSLGIQQETIDTLPFYYLADADGPSGHDTTSTVSGSATDTNTNWNEILSPSVVNTAPEGFWFIDAAYYHGTYDPILYGTCVGAFFPSYWQALGVPLALPPSNDPAMYGDAVTTSGFNKGIEPDGNGGAYIYLSYSNLQNAETGGSLHTDSTDTNAIWQCGNAVSNLDVATQTGAAAIYEHGIQELGPFDCDNTQHWTLGELTINSYHNTVDEHRQFFPTSRLRFAGGDEIYTILATPEKVYHVNFTGFQESDDLYTPAHDDQLGNGFSTTTYWEAWFDEMHLFGSPVNRRITYKIHLDKDPTDPQYGFNPVDPVEGANATDKGHIFFIEENYVNVEGQIVSADPAIWETEPKKDVDLDIYYEVDGTYPLEINSDTNYVFAPKGSTISFTNFGNPISSLNFLNPSNAVVQAWVGNKVILSDAIQLAEYFYNNTTSLLITFHRPDGSCVSSTVDGWDEDELSEQVGYPTWNSGYFLPANIVINKDVSKQTVSLSWFNCYSFGNGVESQRVRDDYNQIVIDKGAKASSTLNKPYKEEHRKYGLIYSGLYNSTASINNLNQFIAAEKITKDISPAYGSIQKLHSRSSADGDLIVLCEDRILKILANKDAVFNADGNSQLTATQNVLGQTIPYSGEYGISKNPESFASENYRVYFADKVRGVVMRLSKDGLTPISSHGMKDWFRDNLKLSTRIIGSYNDRDSEYNITLASDPTLTTTTAITPFSWTEYVEYPLTLWGNPRFHTTSGVVGIEVGDEVEITAGDFSLPPSTKVNSIIFNQATGVHEILCSALVTSNAGPPAFPWLMEITITGDRYHTTTLPNPIGGEKTLSFREDVRGWVSFKSFIPENGISCASEYYTFQYGKAFMHNLPTQFRNTFYGATVDSTFTVILNDVPGSVKSFDTINYEGSQARVTQFTGVNINGNVFNDGQYHNLSPARGWYVDNVKTDQEIGGINEFIEKEGKWFSYMKGTEIMHYEGELNGLPAQRPTINPDGSSTFDQASFAIQGLGVLGGSVIINGTGDCMDPSAFNYNPSATFDDGSCEAYVYGCMELSASNTTYPLANTEDGSCTWFGCYDPFGEALPSSVTIFGADATNYNQQYPGAIVDDGSCIDIVYGCMDPLNSNYNPLANMPAEGGSPEACDTMIYGCLLPEGINYYGGADLESGLCMMPGCVLSPNAPNYLYSTVTGAPFSSDAINYIAVDPAIHGIYDDGSCIEPGCMDGGGLTEMEWNALGYPMISTQTHTGLAAGNYSANATDDDGSCLYCGDATANNFDGGAPHSYAACQYCQIQDWGMYAISGDIVTGELELIVTAETMLGGGTNSAVVGSIEVVIIDTAAYAQPNPLVLNFDTTDMEYDATTSTWTITVLGLNLYAPVNINVEGECSDSNSNIITYTTTAFGTAVNGCTEIFACNYNNSANTDDGSCEYYSCSGCSDPTAISSSYNMQNTGPNIGTGCTTQIGCTIACGNGVDSTSGGAYSPVDPLGCCVYDVLGCTDVAYDNYNPLATIDDGSCIMYVYGCTDPAYVQYDPLANVDDGSCVDIISYGCTHMHSCNFEYDQFGNSVPGMVHDCAGVLNGSDTTCCAVPFSDVSIGGVIGQNPQYESTGATSHADLWLETTRHFVGGGGPDVNIGLNFSLGGYLSNVANLNMNIWERNDDDTAWSLVMQHQLANAGTVLASTNGDVIDFPFTQDGTTYWSVDPADQYSNLNYDFKPYDAFGHLRKYMIRIGQYVDGVEYGWSSNPFSGSPNIAGCGAEIIYEFDPVGCMTPDIFGGQWQNPILGCIDAMACNNDCAVDSNGYPTSPTSGSNCGDGVTCHNQQLCTMPPDTATCVTTTDNGNTVHTCVADACYLTPGPYQAVFGGMSAVQVCESAAFDPWSGYDNKCMITVPD